MVLYDIMLVTVEPELPGILTEANSIFGSAVELEESSGSSFARMQF